MIELPTFNRVLGLKFLYENFPYYFNKNRIELYFVDSKKELIELNLSGSYDTLVLKRSGDNKYAFLSDIKCKDNRFFKTLSDLKIGAEEFEDRFIFCVECHKFKQNENYYSDKLAIVQFSTQENTDFIDRISFIPSVVPGVSTRDNSPYLMVEFPYNHGNIFHVKRFNEKMIEKSHFSNYDISYIISKLHNIIDNIRDFLIAQNCHNTFQLIIRIDSYLNLLPIDFRTPEAWATIKS